MTVTRTTRAVGSGLGDFRRFTEPWSATPAARRSLPTDIPVNVEYHGCQYYSLPHMSRGLGPGKMTLREFAQVDFTPRVPICLTMPWERAT